MWLQRLSLRNVRCFARYDIAFHPKTTLITGANGSGKSTILEAIHLLGTLRSFRTPIIRDIIPWDGVAFSLRGIVQNDEGITDHIHVAYSGEEKVVELNDVAQLSRRELVRVMPIVSVSEEDMRLIQGYPEVRRMFLDQVAMTINHAHRDRLMLYQQIARQRTALLVQQVARTNVDLSIWTEKLCAISADIRNARREALQRIVTELEQIHTEDISTITCTYQPSGNEDMSVDEWIAAYYDREVRMKRNLSGAHLDDIVITKSDTTARRFQSRGMQKLVMLALKVAHVRIAKQAILLLDDIMSDFDEIRFNQVVQLLQKVPTQKILTSPLPDDPRCKKLLNEDIGLLLSLDL